MRLPPLWTLAAAIVMLGCGPEGAAREAPVVALPPTTAPGPAAPVPAPSAIRQDIRATRLEIPALGIDVQVQRSDTIAYVDSPPPGCTSRPSGQTVTVPEQGVATPVDSLEGLENKAWIYGHSRWQGRPGTFFRLQDIEVGDELFVEGTDRRTGDRVARLRFVVERLYLADIDSGDALVNADGPEDVPDMPLVILQTSVRESGSGKQWIFDRQKLTAKAENRVQGDLNDPCKYLLLFVFARLP